MTEVVDTILEGHGSEGEITHLSISVSLVTLFRTQSTVQLKDDDDSISVSIVNFVVGKTSGQETRPKVFHYLPHTRKGLEDPYLSEGPSKYNNRLNLRYSNILSPGHRDGR